MKEWNYKFSLSGGFDTRPFLVMVTLGGVCDEVCILDLLGLLNLLPVWIHERDVLCGIE